MKTNYKILLLMLGLFFSCKEKIVKTQGETPWVEKKEPLIMAHRGILSDDYAENALYALDSIYALSKDILIEFDVRMTKDSILVLLHDETLDRTTTGSGFLKDFTFDEIQKLQLVTNNLDTIDHKIPTFKEVLKWSKGKNKLAIDAKLGTDRKKIAKIVLESGVLKNCFIICYSLEDAQLYLSMNPNFELALGFNSWEDLKRIQQSDLPLKQLIALTPTELQDSTFYKAIHQLGIPISFGTYQTLDKKEMIKKEYEDLQSKGIDIITTNKAKEVYELLK